MKKSKNIITLEFIATCLVDLILEGMKQEIDLKLGKRNDTNFWECLANVLRRRIGK